MEVMEITDIPGVRIGNAQNLNAGTGCTVILCPQGAVAGVDVRGGSPGTRETDLLKSENQVDKVNAVLLAGGSAFGLDAAAGIMEFLEEKNIGFDAGITKVPIVSGAVLFDLVCGDYHVRPDKAMGYQACTAAWNQEFSQGSVGAGTGATVGKFFGLEHAMKGGLGSYCIHAGDLIVGAVVAVNCLGDVIDPESRRVLAGAWKDNPFSFISTEEGMVEYYDKMTNVFAGNTTIGAIITNGDLTKTQANKAASMAHNGYARTIRPAHTMFDGDTIFLLSTGKVEADVSVVGLLAARVMEKAVISAVKKAAPLFGFKAYSEVQTLDV